MSRRWELLSHFTYPQLDQLGGCVELRHAAAGSHILREGDPTTDTYLIATGGVRIHVPATRETKPHPTTATGLGRR